MPLNPEQFLAAVTDLNREQVRQAGQRYTPGIDPVLSKNSSYDITPLRLVEVEHSIKPPAPVNREGY